MYFISGEQGKRAVFMGTGPPHPRRASNSCSLEAVNTFFFNPLITGGLFLCYMLNKFICNFRDVSSILLLLFYF